MLKPLYWMFKTEGVKENVLYLIVRMLILYILTLGFIIAANFCSDIIIIYSLYVLALLCFLAPSLMVQGYFWELTERIINRERDITSSSIYSKKAVKEIEIIEMPVLGLWKLIWRGFASLIATLMLLYPIIMLIVLSFITSQETFMLFNFDYSQITLTYLGIYCFIGLFVPALLWNYANRNSLFAVWNLPKAIHIMGTYPVRYCLRVIQFLILFFIAGYINVILRTIAGIDMDITAHYNDTFSIIIVIIYFALAYIINLYWVFVYAYILGTIAPTEEA